MYKGITNLSLFLFFLLTCVGCGEQVAVEESNPDKWTPDKNLLQKKENLSELNLSNKGYIAISAKIGEFEAVEKLDLKGNKLTDLPSEISNLKKVRKLNLSKNDLSELPPAVLEMEGIKELDLRHNKLEKLPESIKKLSKLHTLYIGNNPLEEAERATIRVWLPKTKVIIGNDPEIASGEKEEEGKK